MKRRVVITGIGVISAIGAKLSEFWENCLAAKTVVLPIPSEWHDCAEYQCSLWSPLPKINFRTYGITRLEELQYDPVTLHAICAALQALEHAAIAHELVDPKLNSRSILALDLQRCGVFMGSGIGGAATFMECTGNHVMSRRASELDEFIQGASFDNAGGPVSKLLQLRDRMIFARRFNPFVVSMVMPNASASALSIKFGLHGPARTFCAACASATVAIGHAFEALRRGEIDMALAGGSEYLQDQHGGIFRGFDGVGALIRDCSDPDKANCPFDERHSGFLFSGGGASVLVLEDSEHALKRGAVPIAAITGYAESSDGYHMMLMEEHGRNIKCMLERLLTEASISAEEIDYINTHGTGTPTNDIVEARVIDELFGARPLVNTTKSLIGHSLGASGAIEAAVTALSLRHGTTHVCRNLKNPLRDLNFVTSVPNTTIETAISQSFGFGGHNAALLLQRC